MQQSINHQSGYTLMVSLIFMIILTIIATMSTDSTTFEVRMSMNAELKSQSLECSERLRNSVADMMESLELAQAWAEANDGVADDVDYKGILDKQLKVLREGDSAKHLVVNIGNASEQESTSNCNAADLDKDSNESLLCNQFVSDVALVDGQDQVLATLSIYRVTQKLLPGFGAGQNMDYRGPGVGMASATAVFFHMRSVSETACSSIPGTKTHARTITESDYRLIPI